MDTQGIRAVSEYVARGHGSGIVWAWCAASPAAFASMINSPSRTRQAAHERSVHYLSSYEQKSGCVCTVRVDRMGITLNEFHHTVPLWLVTWHTQLLYRLFGPVGVAVHVTDLDSLVLNSLLSAWEGTPVQVTALTSRHRLSTCVSAHRRSTGRVFSVLAGLQDLVLLPSPSVHGSLVVAEYAPLLRRVTASKCCVEYLKPLSQLQHLQEVQLSQTLIRDAELRILAQLPLLTTLDVSSCPHLSSLEPLACAASLRILRASSCERLMLVAQLGTLATLRIVDLSGNVFRPTEFASFITQPTLHLQAGYFAHMRWPRDDPPSTQVLGSVKHLHLSYGTVPNIRWLCGAHSLEQLCLDHTNVTAVDMAVLVQHTPLLSVLSLSYCEHLHTNLDFTRSLHFLAMLTITRSSLPSPFLELVELQQSLSLTLS
ncbi:conserved hypothetical protein [Leishmania major strain Friedlin]|uniref:Leucine-rich repeat protein n=1 Tax=Leishmania major TaxID=5664 RepID=Q4Q7U4_LEIMA|nr:conserved hypothetical protein [Leishmania major strain Friedlin]CAG9578108.1 hypothetical_protein_-_conserved [Leishmania major strain Friedlin]CAJ05780.1 conserved hypothetical protein [Leishmania major strain Friedlin]|eukprot:XP_001684600.1 conserved hypothetical protein [Leishmania major strain Friedlin]